MREVVDSVPVLLCRPEPVVDRHRLAVWLPYFTGTKEAMAPTLERLAGLGFTAVSLDPWQHGERGTESGEQLGERVFAHFRQGMWPILGQTTLDAIHVVDWALSRFDLDSDVVAGGLSMGGDISVALAGADHRVTRVAAIVATPDWTRPGMTRLDDPSVLIDQGEPSGYAAWLYESLDPITHLESFAHGPAIRFDLGAEDTHVPPHSAAEFVDGLRAVVPGAAARMVVVARAGLGHDAAREEAVLGDSIAWLAAE